MYAKKTPKSQEGRAEPYTVFNPHTKDINNRDWSKDPMMYVVSIDPGRKNFAIRVETRHIYNRIPIIPRMFAKIDFKDTEDKDPVEWKLFGRITQLLDSHKELLMKSHIVIVEKQLKENYKAVRVSQHVLTYFMCLLQDLPPLALIMEVDSKLKGRMLGCPKYCDVKKWSIEKAQEILTLRQDTFSLRTLNENKKTDDLSDTITQVEALFLKLQWLTTYDLYN